MGKKGKLEVEGIEFDWRNNESCIFELYDQNKLTYKNFRYLWMKSKNFQYGTQYIIRAGTDGKAPPRTDRIPSKKIMEQLKSYIKKLVHEDLIPKFDMHSRSLNEISQDPELDDLWCDISFLLFACDAIEENRFRSIYTRQDLMRILSYQRRQIYSITGKKLEEGPPKLKIPIGFDKKVFNKYRSDTLFLVFFTSRGWRKQIASLIKKSGRNDIDFPENLDSFEAESSHVIIPAIESGALTYERFRLLAEWNPYFLQRACQIKTKWQNNENYKERMEMQKGPNKMVEYPPSPHINSVLTEYITRFLNERFLPDFPLLFPLMSGLPIQTFQDPKYLLFACRYYQDNKIRTVKKCTWTNESPESALIFFLMQCRPRINEDFKDVVSKLREFDEDTLLLCGCLAYYWRNIFEEALGMKGFGELIGIIYGLSTPSPSDSSDVNRASFHYNCVNPPLRIDVSADLDSGFIDRQRLLSVAEKLGEKNIKKILDTFNKRIKIGKKDALFMVEVALGMNEEEVIKKFENRNHLGVKAYGAMADKNDVRERYNRLKMFEEETKQFGIQRSVHEKASAKVALRNLAQVAGFKDEVRLGWALGVNAELITGLVPLEFSVNGYECKYVIEDSKPILQIRKNGKKLSSIPKPVKESEHYKRIKDANKIIRKSSRRYKKIFEDSMISGEWFKEEDFRAIDRDPIARQLLSRLVIIDEELNAKLMDFDAIPKKARIAHPYDLLNSGNLLSAQKLVLNKEIKQPFKQVFRELYVLTPAEKETNTYSNRFAGNIVAAGKATALLSQRGWICKYNDFPTKHFGKGLSALIDTVEQLQYYENITLDKVVFNRKRESGFGSIPLEDVDPILFSETMRDVDLIVSVAGISEDRFTSQETMYMRADLVKGLIEKTNLKNVELHGNHVKIEGKLASYRIHLGSGSVHLGDTQYLCVVPDKIPRKRIFLPFEEQDQKTAEILSKIYLFAEDHNIKTPSILSQINRSRPGTIE
jgi:hypothetical protein